jgi:hypothetical protein
MENKSNGPTKMLPFSLLAAAVCVCAIVLGLQRLPPPVSSTAPDTTFSEARAVEHVAAVLGLGLPRTVGTYVNEVLTPEYISKVVTEVGAAAALLNQVTVELSIQKPTGTFELDFLDGELQGVQYCADLCCVPH